MADLSIDFAGIRSPNPFWLATAPPTNTGDQVMRAFDAGWGGAVWKTLGDPIVNTSSRFGALDYRRRAHGRLQQHRADHRPAARREPARDRRVQAALPEARAHRVADGRVEGRLARDHPPRRGHRRRRPRAQLRLPARHVRARHGLGGRAGARGAQGHHRLGGRVRARAGAGQAHAQHRRHHRSRRRRRRGRRPRPDPHQHDQEHHRRRPRPDGPLPRRRRPLHERRLLRPGGQADRAAHGRGPRARPARHRADLRHRRHRHLARRGRVHRPRAPPACRCARRSCTTASASSRT